MKLLSTIKTFLRQSFCRHQWEIESDEQYAILGVDGLKCGQVNLMILTCPKCQAVRFERHSKQMFAPRL